MYFILHLYRFYPLQVRKNALKSAKKRIKNKNAENSPSFCFYSGIDDGGDMGKFEEVSSSFDRNSNMMNNEQQHIILVLLTSLCRNN